MTTKTTSALETTSQNDKSLSEIDAAVAAQAARKAAKAGKAEGTTTTATAEGEKKKRTVLTPQERIDRAKKLEDERAARKTARQAASAANKQAAEEKRGTPHMSKVEKAAKGLAPMDADTQALFDEVKGSLSGTQITILTAHLSFLSRSTATAGSLEVKLTEGQRVTILSGAPKYIGRTGKVKKAQRIHCFIEVEALEGAPQPTKDLYLFNYDVKPIEAEAAADSSEPEAGASEEQASDAPAEQAA